MKLYVNTDRTRHNKGNFFYVRIFIFFLELWILRPERLIKLNVSNLYIFLMLSNWTASGKWYLLLKVNRCVNANYAPYEEKAKPGCPSPCRCSNYQQRALFIICRLAWSVFCFQVLLRNNLGSFCLTVSKVWATHLLVRSVWLITACANQVTFKVRGKNSTWSLYDDS